MINRVLNTIAAEHAGLGPVQFAAELLALGKHSRTRDAPDAFGDDGTFHLDAEGFARLGFQAHAAIAEAVLGHFVAVADHVEPRFTSHQFRCVECNDARVVREKFHLMRGAQFHHRHRPAAASFNDLDATRWRGGR